MARFFADTAQKQHQEDDLNRIFSFADDGQDLAFHLYGLLSQAYRQAQIKTGKNENRDQAIHFYAGRADCHTALRQLLHQYIEGSSRHREKAVIRIFLISPFTATTRQLS